jgi:hypothetical protein
MPSGKSAGHQQKNPATRWVFRVFEGYELVTVYAHPSLEI